MKIKYIVCSIFTLFFIVSCDNEELAELNINPNTVNSLEPGYTFASAQLGTSNRSWTTEVIYCGMMSGQLASLETYYSGDKYTLNESYATGLWGYYGGVVKSLVNLKTQLAAPEDVNKLSMVRIWLALVFSKITDLHGDVPYFEAGLGYLENLTTPVYNLQSDIYKDLLKELEESLNAFTNTQNTFENQDIVYNGDL